MFIFIDRFIHVVQLTTAHVKQYILHSPRYLTQLYIITYLGDPGQIGVVHKPWAIMIDHYENYNWFFFISFKHKLVQLNN